MKTKLLLALARVLVEADFKTAKIKFQNQDINTKLIDEYFSTFKKLKDKNQIKDNKEKDIDVWARGDWDDFKKFVDSFEEKKTKTEK